MSNYIIWKAESVLSYYGPSCAENKVLGAHFKNYSTTVIKLVWKITNKRIHCGRKWPLYSLAHLTDAIKIEMYMDNKHFFVSINYRLGRSAMQHIPAHGQQFPEPTYDLEPEIALMYTIF